MTDSGERADIHAGMRHLRGREFTMGSDAFYPEERPPRRIWVDSFWIDESPITNREFAEFVAATGYSTLAETPPDPSDYPGMPPDMAQPGSLVFRQPSGPISLDDFGQWWAFTVGAKWQQPLGPHTSIEGLEDHPVVHIAYPDAEAYASWAGKSLPTEAEWEYAARGGLEGAEYGWGSELAPGGRMLANYWQGDFPCENLMLDGWERTSPVAAYPPNGFGLYDMIGNVWEWTSDWYDLPKTPSGCCSVALSEAERHDPWPPQGRIGRKVIKGGSHLCAPNYCERYRPAARSPQAIDTSTSHIGFRCILRSTNER